MKMFQDESHIVIIFFPNSWLNLFEILFTKYIFLLLSSSLADRTFWDKRHKLNRADSPLHVASEAYHQRLLGEQADMV